MEKMPELMRMQVSISAADADIEQALAKLKQKQEGAIKKLVELGTAKSVITVEPPTLTPDPAETALRRMRMMRGEMEEEEEEGEAKPAKVNVSLTLKAEWPLDAADPEAMLVAVHTLQKKINDADLAGLKDEKLSEEELEERAEMEEQMSRFSSDDETKPGEPVFVFVWKATDADRTKLLSEAFAKAKANAEKLATAAGVQLGGLSSLTSHGIDADDYRSAFAYGQSYYQIVQRTRGLISPEREDEEAVGVLPQKIGKRVTVIVSYKIK